MKRFFAAFLALALLCGLLPLAANAVSIVDSDYDGIEDAYDNAPNNNSFPGTMTASSNDCGVSYKFDYRWFFNSPYTYNADLCKTSLVFSTLIYSQGAYAYDTAVRYSGGTVSSSSSILTFLRLHGFENPVDYNFTEYTDDDVSEIALGHRKVTYNGTSKHVVIVDVRGTNGTVKEWSSNFDMGDHNKFGSTADWTHYNNHKGFDVAATRALKRLTTYTNAYTNDGTPVVYWVMGHSRGAAIANILSSDLIDEGKTVFGYTFATPNTTTRKLAHDYKYTTIFNVVNEDDFVPCVPMDAWGFMRYGKSAKIDMTDDYQNEWHGVTGSSWYNEMADSKLTSLCTKLAGVASGWDDCYVYHCSCHGDGTRDDMTEDGLSYSEVYEDYSARARQYCKISTYTNFWGTTKYKACQLPAFFMQALADVMASSGLSMVTTLTGYDLAARYESARNQVVICAAAGISDPHLTETYYVLATHAVSSSFARGTISTCTHTYSVYSTMTYATCTAAGRAVYRCSKCGDKYKGDVAPLGHSYTPVVTEPTCISPGYTKYRCTRCQDYVYGDFTDPTGHTWGASTVVTPATEYAAGLLRHTCTVCGETEEEIIPQLDHTHRYTETVIPPTCTEEGYTLHSCSCGDSYMDNYTSPAGHTPDEPVTENVTDAACLTDGGYDTVVYCAVCSAQISREHTVFPASGHSWGPDEIVTAATCTADGSLRRTCTQCLAVTQEAIPATGHSYTYTEAQDGTVTAVCETCGDTFSNYRITFSVPGFANEPEGGMYSGGDTFVLPELQTVCGYAHMGFVTAPIAESSVQPVFFQKGAAYTVTGTETLYAVYAYYKDGGEIAGNIYYPVYTGTSESLVNAMSAVGAAQTSYAYRRDNVAAAVYCYGYEGTAQQNIALVNLLKQGMLIDPEKTKNLTKYYTTSPAGCARMELTEEPASCTEQGSRYGSCPHCGDVNVTIVAPQGHDFLDGVCTRCGIELDITSAFPRIDEDISLIYTASVPEGFENAHMTFTFLGGSYDVSGYTVDENGQYRFEFPKILPQYMGENITAVLHAVCGGTEYSDTVAGYSVRQYCVNQLAANPDDAALKTLLSDMLVYGAAAQTYANYKTDALVTAGLSLTPGAFAGISGKTISFEGERDADCDWSAATLVLRNKLAVRFFFIAESTEGLTVLSAVNGREQTFGAEDFVPVDGKENTYCIEARGIGASEFDDSVSAVFLRGGVQTGRTVRYSVNAYLCGTQNCENANLRALVRALYCYGASAAAYAAR